MIWILPTPMIIAAGGIALVLLVDLFHRPVSNRRLAVETFLTTLVVIGAVQVLWIALWLIEHRW